MYREITEYGQIITPDSGFVLLYRGDPEGKPKLKIILPLNIDSSDIIEVKDENIPILVPKINDENIVAFKLDELREYLISLSKEYLEEFLEKNPILYEGKFYSVTSKTQSHLSNMIKASEDAISLGMEFQPTWNSINSIREPYNLLDLKKLSISIQTYVNSLVKQQQIMEEQINNTSNKEDLLLLNLGYKKEGQ